MSRKESLLVVATLEPVEVGDRFEKVPLHVTLLPWFEICGEHRKTLDDHLAVAAADHPPINIVGEGEAMFGAKNDIRVQRVGSQALTELHEQLLHTINQFGSDYRNNWVGQDFVAHVTYLKDAGLGKEQQATLNALQLFSRLDQDAERVVEAAYPFQLKANSDV